MILVQMLKDIDEPKGTIAPTKGSENAISEAIKKAGKDFQLGNPVAGSGGFIFQSNKVEIDYRFDTLLESNLQNRLEKEIFQKLFN
jgi:vacuolar-type H+-ATPase subunit E/Vma4